MTPRLRRLLIAAIALSTAPAARAETVVQDVTVTASIEAACTVFSAILNFGEYEPNSGRSRDSSAQLNFECPEGAAITIRLDGGLHSDGGDRRMKGGQEHFLRYNLYTERLDLEGRRVWGDGLGFGQPVTTIFSWSNPYRPVFGTLPGGQSVPPGVYTDTVTITVTVDANVTH